MKVPFNAILKLHGYIITIDNLKIQPYVMKVTFHVTVKLWLHRVIEKSVHDYIVPLLEQ